MTVPYPPGTTGPKPDYTLFHNLGLIGWGHNEAVMLAAMVADLPIMMAGAPGTSKTQAASALAKAIYGKGVKYHGYFCPTLHPEMMTGPVNPEALRKGRGLEYFRSGSAVWEKQVVFLDEPSRATNRLQNELLEFVRTRTWLGEPTEVQMVISAMNPPDTDPSAVYLNNALASRFVYVWAPDLKMIAPYGVDGSLNNFREMLYSNVGNTDPGSALAFVLEARTVNPYPALDQHKMAEAIAQMHHQLEAAYQATIGGGRRAQHIRRLLEAVFQLASVDRSMEAYVNPEDLGRIIHAVCPEFYGVVHSNHQVGNGAHVPPNFIKNMGTLAYNVLHPALRKLGLTAKTFLAGIPLTASSVDWAHEALSRLEALPDDMVNAAAIGEIDKIPEKMLPADMVSVLRNRFNLRSIAINRPENAVSVNAYAAMLRRGIARPKSECRPEISGSVPAIRKVRDVFNSAEFVLPASGYGASVKRDRNKGKAFFFTEDTDTPITMATTNPIVGFSDPSRARTPKNVYIISLSQVPDPGQNPSGVRSHMTTILIDPLARKDEDRIMIFDWMKDTMDRAIAVKITSIAWSTYLRCGLALFKRPTYTVTSVLVNPTWNDAEEIGLHSLLCHGMEARDVMAPDFDEEDEETDPFGAI